MVVILGIFSIIIALYLKNILGALLMAVAIYSGAFIIPTLLGILEAIKNKELSTAISINRMHLEKSMNFILSKLSA